MNVITYQTELSPQKIDGVASGTSKISHKKRIPPYAGSTTSLLFYVMSSERGKGIYCLSASSGNTVDIGNRISYEEISVNKEENRQAYLDAIDLELDAMTPEQLAEAIMKIAGAWANVEGLSERGFFPDKNWGFESLDSTDES